MIQALKKMPLKALFGAEQPLKRKVWPREFFCTQVSPKRVKPVFGQVQKLSTFPPICLQYMDNNDWFAIAVEANIKSVVIVTKIDFIVHPLKLDGN
jgi:hypothetical protein